MPGEIPYLQKIPVEDLYWFVKLWIIFIMSFMPHSDD